MQYTANSIKSNFLRLVERRHLRINLQQERPCKSKRAKALVYRPPKNVK